MKTFALNIFLFALLTTSAFAQQSTPTHVPWTKEDSVAINALVLYPDSVRLNIFEACEYPAVIVRIASIQKNSSSNFAALVSGYSKQEQEDVWNLTRYPGLISKLANCDKNADASINTILSGYPADAHDIGLKYAKNYHDILVRIDSLNKSTDTQYNALMAYYPQDVQQTFNRLLNYPEILGLLNDHLSLTVRVGDHYKRDPQYVIHKADSANQAEVKRNAQDAEEWKQTVSQDTSALNDLKSTANEYADSNGYQTSQVDQPIDQSTVTNYTCYPYSYWFGYPTWYPYSYWYPYPYWYDWGFYYGPGGNIVFFGAPSYYFLNWYFYYPWHWHHHPWFGSACVHYYYGPRRLYTINAQVVHRWVYNNRNYMPSDFMTNKASRIETVRELGQLNEAVQKPGHVSTEAERNTYLKENSGKFNALNSNPERPAEKMEGGRIPANEIQQPTRQPAVYPREQPSPQKTYTPPANNYNNIHRAQEYHRNTWERTEPTYHPAPSPAPRMQSPRSFSPGRR